MQMIKTYVCADMLVVFMFSQNAFILLCFDTPQGQQTTNHLLFVRIGCCERFLAIQEVGKYTDYSIREY
jgi:hypothetical protein